MTLWSDFGEAAQNQGFMVRLQDLAGPSPNAAFSWKFLAVLGRCTKQCMTKVEGI